jgi:hypothetical protein
VSTNKFIVLLIKITALNTTRGGAKSTSWALWIGCQGPLSRLLLGEGLVKFLMLFVVSIGEWRDGRVVEHLRELVERFRIMRGVAG